MTTLKEYEEQRLIDALAVVILDKTIREFLEKNDPKCLEQCISALRYSSKPRAQIVLNRLRAIKERKDDGVIIPSLFPRRD